MTHTSVYLITIETLHSKGIYVRNSLEDLEKLAVQTLEAFDIPGDIEVNRTVQKFDDYRVGPMKALHLRKHETNNISMEKPDTGVSSR